MPRFHKCERFDRAHRNQRRCLYCRRLHVKVRRGDQLVWEPEMTWQAFANNWLPAISGTNPVTLLKVEVAFPFEWNSYESWNTVVRVQFAFDDLYRRAAAGLGTRVDVMDGWQSKWHEFFNHVDEEARVYYREQTGARYEIGDNTYEQMRRIIQS